MIGKYRLVLVTPAGRRRYLEVLRSHILKCNLVDQWALWANTHDAEDLKWMDEAAKAEPRIAVDRPEWQKTCNPGNYEIFRYYDGCVDPNTIYIRLDDDIVWMGPDAIEKLAAARIANPKPVVLFGNIVNNGLTSYWNQKLGRLTDKHGECKYECMCGVGWNNDEFALDLHRSFLAKPDAKSWALEDREFVDFERFSVNVFAFTGEMMKKWQSEEKVGQDEEMAIAVGKPRKENCPNGFVGDAVFVHYAFYTQRRKIDGHPEILARYRHLAGL